jgi:hypothetical protein
VAAGGFTAALGAAQLGAPRGGAAGAGVADGGAEGAAALVDLGFAFAGFVAEAGADGGGAEGAAEGAGASASAISSASASASELVFVVRRRDALGEGPLELRVPVFRRGVAPAPAGSPHALQAALAGGALHLAYATRDLSPRSGCGAFARQAGVVAFAAGESQAAVLLAVARRAPCRGAREAAIALDLMLPGGARVRGVGYSVVVRVEWEESREGVGEEGCECGE